MKADQESGGASLNRRRYISPRMTEQDLCTVRYGHRRLRHRLDRARHCRRAACRKAIERATRARVCSAAFRRRSRPRRRRRRSAPSTASLRCSRRNARPRRHRDRRCAPHPDFNRTRLRHRADHPGRADPDLRRDRRAARRQVAGPRRRPGAGQNPIPIVMPCHRVLAAGGKTGGFSAPGGVRHQIALLSIEGARAWRADLVRAFAVADGGRAAAAETSRRRPRLMLMTHLHEMGQAQRAARLSPRQPQGSLGARRA